MTLDECEPEPRTGVRIASTTGTNERPGAFDMFLIIERCDTPLESIPYDQRVGMIGAIARDVLQGLSFIHRNEYVHKDMHAGNVLLHRKKCPLTGQEAVSFRISDLGISNLEGRIGQGTTVMAQWMMPPERLRSAERDLLATVYPAIGIRADTIVYNHLNQPRELVKGEAVLDLFA